MGKARVGDEPRAGHLWWLLLAVAVASAVAGGGFYSWLLGVGKWDSVADWGARGDALAPLAAFLTALALTATVISVRLQGIELAMQRKEMAEGRKVQQEQQKAQDRLAAAQEAANKHARMQVEATMRNTLATLELARATANPNSKQVNELNWQIAALHAWVAKRPLD